MFLETARHHPWPSRGRTYTPVCPVSWHPQEALTQSCAARSLPTTPASRYMRTRSSTCVQIDVIFLRCFESPK